MKGIYLTEEGKKQIESKISELEYIFLQDGERFDTRDSGKYNIYKEILSSATILPEEESWDGSILDPKDSKYVQKQYPNGVIMKQSQ